MESVINTLNNVFSNDLIRYATIMLTGVYAGYTLQPVPRFLNDLFDNSTLFKLIILLFIGFSNFHPLDSTKVQYIVISSVAILILFSHMRKM
jgi:hypothetical protein